MLACRLIHLIEWKIENLNITKLYTYLDKYKKSLITAEKEIRGIFGVSYDSTMVGENFGFTSLECPEKV